MDCPNSPFVVFLLYDFCALPHSVARYILPSTIFEILHSQTPEVMDVAFYKGQGGMGLSIVAAKVGHLLRLIARAQKYCV